MCTIVGHRPAHISKLFLVVPLDSSIALQDSAIETTHPPISEAIPKFTERVIVQLPISQIQPVFEEIKVSRVVAGESNQIPCSYQ